MAFHGEVLNILLDYREKNPDFNFVARQLNRKGKLDAGYYFQGNDKYAFAGLINKSGGLKMTKSVGLIFFPLEDHLKCDFEIKHQGETNGDLLVLYENLKSIFPEGEHLDDENFKVSIGEIDPANPAPLYQFLDKYYSKIRSKAEESGLKKLIISDEKFEKILQNTQQRPKDVNYWIFQGNPAIYDIERALKAGHLKSWKVASHKDKIKSGDKVVLWQTSSNAGCYALAEVISEVGELAEEEYEKQYYKETKSIEEREDRVKIKIIRYLADEPVLWEEIKELPEFENFKAGNQGTNFTATKEQFETIEDLVGVNNKSYYQEVKKIFPPEKVKSFLLVLRNFLQKYDIDLDDERISFNVRRNRNRLVFIIGSRYGLLIQKRKGKTEYSFISSEVIGDDYGKFTNNIGEVEMYWNKVDDLTGLESEIERGFNIELNRQNKTPYSRFKDQEFVNDIFNIKNQMKNIKNPQLNTILYGPPGTGKTFRLQNKYFDDFTVRETSLNREQYLENIVSELTWWQVLSIILLHLKKTKVNDITNHELLLIKGKLSNSKNFRPTVWGRLQAHTVPECQNVNVTERSQPAIFYKDEDSFWTVDKELLEQYYPEAFTLLEEVNNFKPSAEKLIKNYDFVTFHQSFSYEDFIEGIKPKMGEQETEISYEVQDGIFKKLCLKADSDRDNDYAIFIDEINRGNVSAIFGELITLIEKDKRLGEKNELRAKLPYSKEELGVPPNLYIFGTMNTADRSVEALDTALRRRFAFEEVMPIPQILGSIHFSEFNLAEVLQIINDRIEALLDRDHTIGHSYFIKIESGDVDDLKEAFENKIIPLLQEYFYHDYEKIALILGEGFVERKEANVSFAKFDNLDEPELLHSFELRKDIGDIEAAVKNLLNRGDEETA